MKKRYFLLCFLVLPFLGRGQGFYSIFGTPMKDNALKTIEIPNENAFLVIYAVSDTLYWRTGLGISKINHEGMEVWQKLDTTLTDPDAYTIHAEADGFRIATSHFNPIPWEYTLRLRKYDFEGEIMEDVEVTAPTNFKPNNILYMPNGNLACISKDWQDQVYSIMMVSPDGNILWQTDNDDIQYSQFYIIGFRLTNDNEFLVVSQPYWQDKKPRVAKFDAQGNIKYWVELPWNFRSGPSAIPLMGSDEVFVMGGDDFSTNFYQTYVGKLDADGQLVWNHAIPINGSIFCHDFGFLQSEPNSWYQAGSIINTSERTFFLSKMDSDGNTVWQKQYYAKELTQYPHLAQDGQGNIYIAGDSRNWSDTNTLPYVIKTNSEGDELWHWDDDDAVYNWTHQAIAAQDGSCVILASGYDDFATDDFQNYLIRIDPSGIVYTHLINGKLAFDTNLNCNLENDEQALEGWKIVGSDVQRHYYTTTKADGSFKLHTNEDSLAIMALQPNVAWKTCPSTTFAFFDVAHDTVDVAMAGQALQNCVVLEVDVSTAFLRRCFTNTYSLTCKNTGTVPTENLQLTVLLDSFFIFQNASLPVASQNGNELVFNVGNLGIGESIAFNIQVEVSCDAELGQVHCLSLTAAADNECTNGGTREFAETQECQPNIGASDPNDKRAFSEGKLVERFIPADSIIEYQIRFQNTGTDTAFNTTVTDTLSNLLNIESIIAGASSHAYRMELEQNNILKFVFNDIMLPDSNVNEAASHGFVKFRIRHKPGLVPGDVIPNKAAIYFDFNEAVITNDLELEIKSPNAVKPPRPVPTAMLKVYPQPAGEMVIFELKSAIGQQPYRLEIMNMLGQKLYDQSIKEGANMIAKLPAGQHFYRLWRDGGVLEVGKVMVVK